MDKFSSDYNFIIEHFNYVPGCDYVSDKKRFLDIVERYENVKSNEGKYYWVTAYAYLLLDRKEYHQGLIINFEKYLNKLPFTEQYKDVMIDVDYANDRGLVRKAVMPNDFEMARKIHIQNVYYQLMRAYQQENDLTNAEKYLNLGLNILPEKRFFFYYEMFNIYRKKNELQKFLSECNKLNPKEKKDFSNMINRAKELINNGYIYRHRKNPIK